MQHSIDTAMGDDWQTKAGEGKKHIFSETAAFFDQNVPGLASLSFLNHNIQYLN
jgi:hypothetical protein